MNRQKIVAPKTILEDAKKHGFRGVKLYPARIQDKPVAIIAVFVPRNIRPRNIQLQLQGIDTPHGVIGRLLVYIPHYGPYELFLNPSDKTTAKYVRLMLSRDCIYGILVSPSGATPMRLTLSRERLEELRLAWDKIVELSKKKPCRDFEKATDWAMENIPL